MKIINKKKYSIIKPSENLIEEAAKNFILECEIEIAKHNTDIYVIDLESVKQIDSSVVAFFVSTFCVKKNTYYCINTNSSILDVFKMMQLDKCITLIESLDEIK
jgi:anti-anti-sigma regulatory factor